MRLVGRVAKASYNARLWEVAGIFRRHKKERQRQRQKQIGRRKMKVLITGGAGYIGTLRIREIRSENVCYEIEPTSTTNQLHNYQRR